MAIIEDKCRVCGTEVIVRTGDDSRSHSRKDGKQVVYKNEPTERDGREYNIFRCEGCSTPIAVSVLSAAYEDQCKA